MNLALKIPGASVPNRKAGWADTCVMHVLMSSARIFWRQHDVTTRRGGMCKTQALLHMSTGIGRIWSEAMTINPIQLHGQNVVLEKMQSSFIAPETFIFRKFEHRWRGGGGNSHIEKDVSWCRIWKNKTFFEPIHTTKSSFVHYCHLSHCQPDPYDLSP